jgi:hypothetical protein
MMPDRKPLINRLALALKPGHRHICPPESPSP